MALLTTTKNQVPVIPTKEVSIGIDKNRFAINENKAELTVSWGYCYCNNCKDNKSFRVTKNKVICIPCSYIIAFI